MKNYFITTPIYYVNDVPHIGHAYTTIAADVLARWKRLNGHPVFFLTGTDEHGQKIAAVAEEKKVPPKEYVEQIVAEYKRLWKVLNITNDDFIQTTEERHQTVVQNFFEKLKAKGHIYKGTYEDWYCVQDETYFTEAELAEGKKCPSCGRKVEKLKEESYFFRLSHFEERLLAFYRDNPNFLAPASRASEIINFVKSGLRDLSVSRTRIKWGVPVPSDPGHVVYVWFDALINYTSAPGLDPRADNPMQPPFSQSWPADVHFVGKEIFRFHAVIWPAMLMALGIPLPKKVFAHGWWTVEGEKMSKSLGNVVDPHEMSEKFGVDAFRYFLLREVNFGSDGDFSRKSLLSRYNSELANNLGNLLQRTTTLLVKNMDGVIPAKTAMPTLLQDLPAVLKQIQSHYDNMAFNDVLNLIYGLMMKTNKFIDDKAPWKLGADQKELLGDILLECLGTLRVLAVLLFPFMPTKTQELWERLGEEGKIEERGKEILASLEKGQWIPYKEGQRVVKGSPLFMRMGSL